MSESSKTRSERWLRAALDVTELTASQIAKKAGVSTTTLTRVLQPEHDHGLSATTVRKIIEAFPALTFPDFIEEPPFAPARLPRYSAMSISARATDRPPAAMSSDTLSLQIPEYDVQFAAGGGFVIDSETIKQRWEFPRSYILDELRLNPRHLVVAEIIGDSMEPTLHSGDRVLIDRSDRRISNPGIFALWDGDGLVAKRLERVFGSDPLMVRVISDNPRHSSYEVPGETVSIVGRIRWRASRM